MPPCTGAGHTRQPGRRRRQRGAEGARAGTRTRSGRACTFKVIPPPPKKTASFRSPGLKISPAAHVTDVTDVCFCFVFRGPGPSQGAGGRPLTERSKTVRPAHHKARSRLGALDCSSIATNELTSIMGFGANCSRTSKRRRRDQAEYEWVQHAHMESQYE